MADLAIDKKCCAENKESFRYKQKLHFAENNH